MRPTLERACARGLAIAAVALCLAGAAHAEDEAHAQSTGFSSWSLQTLYGSAFEEPFNPMHVSKATLTIENSSGWSWGSSYFFADVLVSTHDEDGATEIYSEWYPSLSLGKLSGNKIAGGLLKDISLTAGINAGHKSSGADPLVFLPGLTFDLKLPGFAFASIGAYAYIDQGQLNGKSNGCHSTGVQITPSWMVPISSGNVDFQFSGFADFISSHGDCKGQILSQMQFTIDTGKLIGFKKGSLYTGVELGIWHNKFGLKDLDEMVPQVLLVYKF